MSGALHDVLIQHSHCAEHGKRVHGSHRHRDGTEADAGQAHGTLATIAEAAPTRDASSDEDHEHCAAAARRWDAEVAVVSADVAPAIGAGRIPLRIVEPVLAGDPLELAPKTSPPA